MGEKLSFRAKKSLGQNFLVDNKAVDRVLNSLFLEKDDDVVEIGPGQGALSFKVLENVAEYSAVELDNVLYEELVHALPLRYKENIFHADATTFPFDTLFSGKKLLIFGNLPYSHATPILIHLCGFIPFIKKIVVMVQKEVGDRICSPPGSKDFGLLSLTMQNVFYTAENEVFLPASFRPRPKVLSSLITLTPRTSAQVCKEEQESFFNICKMLFGKRRKTLRSSLKNYIIPGSRQEDIKSILQVTDIDENARVETLSLEKIYRLYIEIEKLRK